MNHGSNDAGCVHEEVVSPVLPVLLNLTGPDMAVVPPRGGKNTEGAGNAMRLRASGREQPVFRARSGPWQDRGALLTDAWQIPGPLSFLFFVDRRASQTALLFTHSQRSAGCQALMCLLLLFG